MPRINPIDPGTAEGKARALLEGIRKKYGRVPNLLATPAQAPAALDAYLGLGQSPGGVSPDGRSREQTAAPVSCAALATPFDTRLATF